MTDDLVTLLLECATATEAVQAESGMDGPSGGAALARKAADRIEALEAALAAMTAERERLALAICGGEDAPGYANAQPVEALEKVARDNAAAWMWQVDQTTKAEARLAKAVAAIGITAEQALMAEIPEGYGPEASAEWMAGYDAAIRHARATLAEIGGA